MAPVNAPAVTPAPAPVVKAPTDTLTSKFDVAGIPVILRRVSANNVVAANLYLLGGTRQLTARTQGIETLLLEASERGTAKYPRDVLRTKMARLGSAIGVGANSDWTTISLRATTTGLDSTWAILADRVMAPRLDPAEVELVRSGGQRQRKRQLSRSVQHDAQVFDEDVDGRQRLVIAGQDVRHAVGEHPARAECRSETSRP